jgi:hypothetical protein
MALEVLNRPAARLVAAARDLPDSPWVLAVGYEDNAASVSWQLDALARELGTPRAGLLILRGTRPRPAGRTWPGCRRPSPAR